MQPGDLVVAVNGTAVDSVDALYRIVSRVPAGTAAAIDVIRRARRMTVMDVPEDRLDVDR
jgi:S1-C subfamily serine protease